MEKICSLVEGIIILIILFFSILETIIIICGGHRYHDEDRIKTYNFFCLLTALLLLFACIICHSVFLGRMIYYNFSYDCSDPITNELFRIQKENGDKIILLTAINLGIDIFIFLIHIVLFITNFILGKHCSFRIVEYL